MIEFNNTQFTEFFISITVDLARSCTAAQQHGTHSRDSLQILHNTEQRRLRLGVNARLF